MVFKCSQDHSVHYTQLLLRLRASHDGSPVAIKVFVSVISLSFKNFEECLFDFIVFVQMMCSHDSHAEDKERYIKKKVKSKTLKSVVIQKKKSVVIQMVMTQVYSLGENELVT